jgi:Fuc2NAc and GlcNAc transferase
MIASYLLTRPMMAYGHRFHLIDLPNDRSSHARPMPRGGGAAIVVASMMALAACAITAHLDGNVASALFTSGGLVAIIGFWDDHQPLSPLLRLAAQVAAGIVLLLFIGVPPALDLGLAKIKVSYCLASLLVVVAVTWLINLTNFMDGIDGLAGSECVFVMSAGGALLYWRGDQSIFYVCFALASATTGFLFLNWPPAKIFMGDVGSGFIGLMFGAVMLIDAVRQPARIWVWLILLAAFLTDSTTTLLRRFRSGRPVWVAHRTHAYQHAALKWGHGPVTLTFMSVNVFWLAPLALCASEYPEFGAWLFALAVFPLEVAAWRFHAGIVTVDVC